MTQETEVKCPNCGATTGAVMESPGVWRCGFCETQFVVDEPQPQPQAPPKREPAPAPPARVEPPPRKKPSAARTAWILVVCGAVMVGVTAVAVVLGGETNGGDSASQHSARAKAATAPAAPHLSATFHFDRTVQSSDGFYVLGEVKNTSKVPIGSAKVYTIMKDAHGHELASESSYTQDDLIAPGESVPFSGIVTKPPHYAQLAFEVDASKPIGVSKPARGLRLVNDRARRGSFGSGWVFSGKVINGGHKPAEFVEVEVMARDAEGKLLGVDSTYADAKLLAPGASTRYEITTYSYPKHVPPKTFYYRVWGERK